MVAAVACIPVTDRDKAGLVAQDQLGRGCCLFRWQDNAKDAGHFEWLQRRMRIQLELGSKQNQCSRTDNTRGNLIRMWPALWTFLHNPLVSPTNNAVERALRGYVIKRKFSYCKRSKRGMEFTECVVPTVQTCKMQARVEYDFVLEVKQSWPEHPRPPCLVPEHIHLQNLLLRPFEVSR